MKIIKNQAHHPLYITWSRMKERCNNPNHVAYHRYGGRGIKVCDRWLDDFKHFLYDMGPKPDESYTLDRIDNDLGYSKDNCRWADRKTQYENRPQTRMVTFRGKTQSIMDWSKDTGLMYQTISVRLRTGWSVEEALTTSLVLGGKTKCWRRERNVQSLGNRA